MKNGFLIKKIMFKKITIFIFTFLLLLNINFCQAETVEEIDLNGQKIAEQLIDKIFSIDFLNEMKIVWDENFSIYYDWFKLNIKPKIADVLEKITSTEEYAKEKEELKNEIPTVFDKIMNFLNEAFAEKKTEEK